MHAFAFLCTGRDALVETPFAESEWSGKAWEAGQPVGFPAVQPMFLQSYHICSYLEAVKLHVGIETPSWLVIRYVFFEMLNYQAKILSGNTRAGGGYCNCILISIPRL